MRPINQTIFGEPNGNCMQACIASILELPLEDVPNFVSYQDHWAAVDEFLERYDLYLLCIPPSSSIDWKPTGYHIMDGKGPRGLFHWVVGRNGEMVHDPHPSGNGLSELLHWGIIARRFDEIPAEVAEEPRYEHAGKLGPWARNGAGGTRYLATGLQEKPVFKRIVSTKKSGKSWRYISVGLEGDSVAYAHGANTNTYVKR